MCGIAGYAGSKPAAPFLLEAMRRLEYRGYDSWGYALQNKQGSHVVRKGLGAFSESFAVNNGNPHLMFQQEVGIGHIRWATHGTPSMDNAHPLRGGREAYEETCWVVHNGVIDNYRELRQAMVDKGYHFHTETDTEVIAHSFDYLSRFFIPDAAVTAELVAQVMADLIVMLKGQYAFAIVSKRFPGYVMAACSGAPLLVSEQGYLASDPRALAGFATGAWRLADDSIAVLGGPDRVNIYDRYLRGGKLLYEAVPEVTVEGRDPDFCPHHMLREIRQQPDLLRAPFSGLPLETGPVGRVVLFGCGSSWHAALMGSRYFEEEAHVPAEAHYASELANKDLELYAEDTFFIALTQSGETYDTLAAMREIRDIHGSDHLLVITNNLTSTAAKLAGYQIDMDLGDERGVAATKTFTVQVASLLELACSFTDGPGMALAHLTTHTFLPDALELLLANEGQLAQIGKEVAAYANVLYLASGINFPVALEGALKLKEVAYIHAEAMPAAEMKHGPIALIDKSVLSIFIAPFAHDPRLLANMEEVRARGGPIIVLPLPRTTTLVEPLVAVVALQLVAYHAAVAKGLPVDRPRNLAKCVTV